MTHRVTSENDDGKTVYVDAEELRQKLELPGHPLDVEIGEKSIRFYVPIEGGDLKPHAREATTVEQQLGFSATPTDVEYVGRNVGFTIPTTEQ